MSPSTPEPGLIYAAGRRAGRRKEEHAGPVVEAKHDATYTVSKALSELEVARSNRTAQVGLFVMARRHAPAGLRAMGRYGNDILVAWDAEDPSTDPYLHAGVILGLALASRAERPADEDDAKALADMESKIQKELTRHEKMTKLVENISRDAEKLSEDLRVGSDALGRLLRNAKDTRQALNVKLAEARKRASPIVAGALEGARGEADAPE